MKKNTQSGFTLIEVLLVIAILAILAAVVIVAINPAKQFGEAQDTQRRSDVRSILDAVQQYSIDHDGLYPDDIPWGNYCNSDGADICQVGVVCDGVSLDALIEDEVYLTAIPNDPKYATADLAGYRILINTAGRVSVCAPNMYADDPFTITQ